MPCLHHAHMRDEISLHIKACKLYSIAVALNLFKELSGNILCRISSVYSGKSSVDIRIVHRPEALLDIDGIMVETWYNQNLIVRCYLSSFLKLT